MTKYFVIFFLFSQQLLLSQEINISGFIRDSKTGKNIPFATVELMKRKLGVAANYQGKFQIQLPTECLNDTIKISSLGYETNKIVINPLKCDFSNVSITLVPVTYTLNEIEILGIPVGKYRLGNYENTTKGYGGWLTEQKSQLAVFMDSKKYKNAKIINASFFIAKNQGKPETPFRVRVYDVDLKTGNPGNDLIHESIIIHGKHKGGWLTVDLSKYNLIAPSNGYFIAMEWINSGDSYYYQLYFQPAGKEITRYGQILSSSKTNKTPNTWLKFLGRDWIIHSEGEYVNALIISEIEVLK